MSNIPATAKKPSDRQAKHNEAGADDDADIQFTFREQSYVIPGDAFDDVEIMELIEDEKHLSVVRQILGTKVWEDWKNANRGPTGRVTGDTTVEFIKAMFEAAGQGN